MAHEGESHIDGNGVAGVLAEVFGTDMTAMPRRCGDCGITSVLGAYRVYRGAGYVMRCPGCNGVAMRIGVFDGAMTLTASGVLTLPRVT
jgi:hypothetical protein